VEIGEELRSLTDEKRRPQSVPSIDPLPAK